MSDETVKLAKEIAEAFVKETAVDTAKELKINTLEINFKTMLEQNGKEHLLVFNELKEIKGMIEKALDQKANKWVEKVVVWGLSCVGVVFIGLLVRWLVLVEIK